MIQSQGWDIFKEIAQRQEAERSLYEFLKQAWVQIEGIPFVGGWCVEAVCEHLEALYRGEIRNLLINIPPRSSKSTVASAVFPAWVWLHAPETQFMAFSHSFDLAIEAALKHRYIITSEWFQLRWGHQFSLMEDQNTKTKFANSKTGYRISTSILSKATGRGCNIQIIDDANNAFESDVDRDAVNNRFDAVLSTRLNDRKKDKRLVIQQRTDANDLTGHILSSENAANWTHLMLPMEFESKRCSKTVCLPSTKGKVWVDPRTKDGELLWPERFGPKEVKEIKAELNSPYLVAGQLQQRPAPAEGALFKKAWFQWWCKPNPPKVLQVIQSWDTAFKKENTKAKKQTTSYSACTTWGLFEDENKVTHLILLNLWRDRVEFPELRLMAKRFYEDYRDNGSVNINPDGKHIPDMVLIESKATGDPLIQELRRAGIMATKFDPTPLGDKIRRAQLISHIIESGRVWVPARPPNYAQLTTFANVLVEGAAVFPNDSDSMDIIDTMSQVIHKVLRSGYVQHPTDVKHVSKRGPGVHYGPS